MPDRHEAASLPDGRAARSGGDRFDGDAEWLLSDGDGGYACGRVDDLPARRYHGLWVARLPGSSRRAMVVAGFDEQVVQAAQAEAAARVSLLHAHWRGHARPHVPPVVRRFDRRPLPHWRFRGEGFELERHVALRRRDGDRAPALLVRWRNVSTRPLRLLVRPLLGWSDADHLSRADEAFDAAVQVRGASWGLRPTAYLPTLWLTADGLASYRAEPAWYVGFHYATDRDRGYDHVGDRYAPGVLELDLPPGGEATLACSLAEPEPHPGDEFDRIAAAAAAEQRQIEAAADARAARLAIGADDFLYRAEGRRLGVLAGFPWFGEWGRDVFVALPGLTIARGRLDLAAEVLTGALPFLRRGLLPNIYGQDAADSRYNSCDAALWFALAVARFADAGGDPLLVRERLVPAVASIADAYVAGAELGLAVERSGLLAAGREDLNATWMDAQTSRGPVTPRQGLPVEIQALWYSLLAFLAEHGERRFDSLRTRCGKEFVRVFWIEHGGWLADRVHDGVADPKVRPNMLVAAALPRSPLSRTQRAGVVAKARADLVTPHGLRTLAPGDPDYRGRYEGGPDQRDSAYHQGTVWPWPGGFYVEAALRAASRKARPAEVAGLTAWLDGLLAEVDRAGIDHVSEVFDGDPPHRPGGTFAQAWNTGELLRARALLLEDAS
jgi:predicted glycogen debranching enzyme